MEPSAAGGGDESELERAKRDRAIAMKVKDKVMLENAELQAKLTILRRNSLSRNSGMGDEHVRAQLIQKEGELSEAQAKLERYRKSHSDTEGGEFRSPRSGSEGSSRVSAASFKEVEGKLAEVSEERKALSKLGIEYAL